MPSADAESPEPLVFTQVDELRKAILQWDAEHRAARPWRDERVPLWQRLVAEVMLVRTRADQVERVWQALVERLPDIEGLDTVTDDELHKLLAPLGLTWRISLLIRLLRELRERQGDVPDDLQELKRLPGVGEYSASALESLHRGRHAPLIDSNVVRLLSRLEGKAYDGETRRSSWLRAMADGLTPEGRAQSFNYGMLDLAMDVCRQRPRCPACPLQNLCATRLLQAGVETG